MADDADIANDFIDSEVTRALGKIRQSQDNKPGAKNCLDCGESMPPPRQKLGFTLCVMCAQERERRKSLYATY